MIKLLNLRIATGDFEELVSERGKNDALWAILHSMAHEIIHYQQWLEDKEMDEKEAENGSEELLDSYYEFL
ncbi:hypothetical protein V3595_27930 [Bacillus sp. CFBP9009]